MGERWNIYFLNLSHSENFQIYVYHFIYSFGQFWLINMKSENIVMVSGFLSIVIGCCFAPPPTN